VKVDPANATWGTLEALGGEAPGRGGWPRLKAGWRVRQSQDRRGGWDSARGFCLWTHPPCPRVHRHSQESMLHRHGSRGARCAAARQPARHSRVVSGALSDAQGIECGRMEAPGST